MDSLPIEALDIAVVLVLVVSGILAYARGFVHEVLSVGAWIGAIFATIYGFKYLQPHTRDLIALELGADLTAGVIIFLVTLVLLSLLTRAAARRIRDSALNFLDRSLGLLFGILRGAVLICLAYLAVEMMMPRDQQPAWLRSARVMPVIEAGAALLSSLVPGDAASSAAKAGADARRLLEKQKDLREMLSSRPTTVKPRDSDGYGRRERVDMERLIESNN